jgi:sporulation protein YlmC with PRC-barrel domain
MNLRKNQLINLPVYTQSGQKLGRVVDFELNCELQEVIKYYVRGENIIKELIEKELIITAEQVISIDDKKMIVEDLVIKEKEAVGEKATVQPIA